MLTSQQKRKENIAEYLLYMWQIEDLIRANNLDIDSISKNIITHYQIDDNAKQEITEWYESLIDMMRLENVIKSGHLQINNNIIIRLCDLHQQLLKSTKYPDYVAEFYRTLPFIVELRSKSGENKSGEIETCFNALYGMLILRLKQQEITPDTAIAMKQIAKFIALLSMYFKKDEAAPLFQEK